MNNNLLCGGNCPYLTRSPGVYTGASCSKYFRPLVNFTEWDFERLAPCVYDELFERVINLEMRVDNLESEV